MEITSCPTQNITKAPGGTSCITQPPALVLLLLVPLFGPSSTR